MKKIFILFFIFITTPLFAAPCLNAGQIAEKFYETGSYIKYMKDNDNVFYAYKSSILGIQFDEDEMDLHILDKDLFGTEEDFVEFSLKRYDIHQDEKGNILIKKK